MYRVRATFDLELPVHDLVTLLHERLGRSADAQRMFTLIITRYPDQVTVGFRR